MKIIMPPQARANEASMLGCTAYMHKELLAMNKAKKNDADFHEWHEEYLSPMLMTISVEADKDINLDAIN